LVVNSLLRRIVGGKARLPAALITGLVGPEKKGGWSVTWVGDGAWPPKIDAASLTDAAEQASSAVAALYAQHPPVAEAELQLAIYPWDYRSGPIFDIAGHAGAFSARDTQGSERSVAGEALEDLVDAVQQLTDLPSEDSMFRWIRPVASLTVPPLSQ